MAKVSNGVETLPQILTGWVGCTNVTGDRQTDGRVTAYSENQMFKLRKISRIINFAVARSSSNEGQRNAFCTSGYVDDVMLSHGKRPESKTIRILCIVKFARWQHRGPKLVSTTEGLLSLKTVISKYFDHIKEDRVEVVLTNVKILMLLYQCNVCVVMYSEPKQRGGRGHVWLRLRLTEVGNFTRIFFVLIRQRINCIHFAFADYCQDRFFLATPFLFLFVSFCYFFVSVPCSRLGWPSRQLLNARRPKYTVSYYSIGLHIT